MGTTDDGSLVVSLTAHAHGWRVIKKGQTLRADEAVVLERPEFFISETASDTEIGAAARALDAARTTRDTSLPASEQKRRAKAKREAIVALTRRRKSQPLLYSGYVTRDHYRAPTGREPWWE